MTKYVFLTETYDDKDKIYCLKDDAFAICLNCSCFDSCKGADLEDGCGCLIAFLEICYRERPIFYGSDLKEMSE